MRKLVSPICYTDRTTQCLMSQCVRISTVNKFRLVNMTYRRNIPRLRVRERKLIMRRQNSKRQDGVGKKLNVFVRVIKLDDIYNLCILRLLSQRAPNSSTVILQRFFCFYYVCVFLFFLFFLECALSPPLIVVGKALCKLELK